MFKFTFTCEFIDYLHFLSLATCGKVGSLASPGPALFTARTLNSYWLPSVNPGTIPLGLSPTTSAAFTHVGL